MKRILASRSRISYASPSHPCRQFSNSSVFIDQLHRRAVGLTSDPGTPRQKPTENKVGAPSAGSRSRPAFKSSRFRNRYRPRPKNNDLERQQQEREPVPVQSFEKPVVEGKPQVRRVRLIPKPPTEQVLSENVPSERSSAFGGAIKLQQQMAVHNTTNISATSSLPGSPPREMDKPAEKDHVSNQQLGLARPLKPDHHAQQLANHVVVSPNRDQSASVASSVGCDVGMKRDNTMKSDSQLVGPFGGVVSPTSAYQAMKSDIQSMGPFGGVVSPNSASQSMKRDNQSVGPFGVVSPTSASQGMKRDSQPVGAFGGVVSPTSTSQGMKSDIQPVGPFGGVVSPSSASQHIPKGPGGVVVDVHLGTKNHTGFESQSPFGGVVPQSNNVVADQPPMDGNGRVVNAPTTQAGLHSNQHLAGAHREAGPQTMSSHRVISGVSDRFAPSQVDTMRVADFSTLLSPSASSSVRELNTTATPAERPDDAHVDSTNFVDTLPPAEQTSTVYVDGKQRLTPMRSMEPQLDKLPVPAAPPNPETSQTKPAPFRFLKLPTSDHMNKQASVTQESNVSWIQPKSTPAADRRYGARFLASSRPESRNLQCNTQKATESHSRSTVQPHKSYFVTGAQQTRAQTVMTTEFSGPGEQVASDAGSLLESLGRSSHSTARTVHTEPHKPDSLHQPNPMSDEKKAVESLQQLKQNLSIDDEPASRNTRQHKTSGGTASPTAGLNWLGKGQADWSWSPSAKGAQFNLWSEHGQGSAPQKHPAPGNFRLSGPQPRRYQKKMPQVDDAAGRLRNVLNGRKPIADRPLPPSDNQEEPVGKDKTLAEMIRYIQSKKITTAESTSSSKPETELPAWRRPVIKEPGSPPAGDVNRLVEMNNFQEYQPPEPVEEAKHKPVFIDPRTQEISIPCFDTSLVEASLLFRIKTSELTKILANVGARVPDEDEQKKFRLTPDIMELVAMDLGQKYTLEPKPTVDGDADRLMQHRATETSTQPSRPPVVAVMGHVDHGKTTLMDALRRKAGISSSPVRKSKKKKDAKNSSKSSGGDIAGTEAGGITQVITAFQVPLLDSKGSGRNAVTFLDTPGHAAFKAMRQSGSDAADIIVLVVAADDGVSPQTIEILEFYKSIVKESGESGISLVVALNKIDKPGIDAEESMIRVANQFLEQGIITENNVPSDPTALDGFQIFGPPVQIVPVSGLRGTGLDDLIEGLALQSEVMDLRADQEASAEGVVMEARVQKGLGIVATCIVRWGSLQKGDIIVSGNSTGKARILKDLTGKQVKAAIPSQPVQLIGFDTIPRAGDPFICVESEQDAQEMVARRKAKAEGEKQEEKQDDQGDAGVHLQSSGRDMMKRDWTEKLEQKYGVDGNEVGEVIRIPIVIKADADGSLAAVRDSLIEVAEKSKQFRIIVDPILAGIGPLLPTEVQIAKESNAPVFCFNIKPDASVIALAEEEEVTISSDKVIYRILDDAKIRFAKFLPPQNVDIVHGRAKVQALFSIGGVDEKVAGAMVTDGQLIKGRRYRIFRDGNTVLDQLEVSSLKHFKEDVNEVSRGSECGVALRNFNDFEEGDEVECYSVETRYPEL